MPLTAFFSPSLLNFILAIFYSWKPFIPNSLRSWVPEQEPPCWLFFPLFLHLPPHPPCTKATFMLYNLSGTTLTCCADAAREVTTGHCERAQGTQSLKRERKRGEKNQMNLVYHGSPATAPTHPLHTPPIPSLPLRAVLFLAARPARTATGAER